MRTRIGLGDVQAQREVLRNAIWEVERAIAEAGHARPGVWAEGVCAALDSLRAALASHVELTEGEDGLFADLMERAPRLAYAIDLLRREHIDLAAAIATAHQELANPPEPPARSWLEHRRKELTELVARFSRHRQRGAELTYEAFMTVLGGGD